MASILQFRLRFILWQYDLDLLITLQRCLKALTLSSHDLSTVAGLRESVLIATPALVVETQVVLEPHVSHLHWLSWSSSSVNVYLFFMFV